MAKITWRHKYSWRISKTKYGLQYISNKTNRRRNFFTANDNILSIINDNQIYYQVHATLY